MAKQHFYSRVPAKVSMFNRTDGYDTFAHSEGLSRVLIESELSSVYNYKPNKNESELVRANKLPAVYFQFCAKSGELIQSTLTYLPFDYTRERTCYMVHSLVMGEEEKKKIFENDDNITFNPSLFVGSLEGFDMSSINSAPDSEYAEIVYKTKKCKLPKDALATYDAEMLKRLIYATLSVSCGKGKNIFIALPGDDITLSERMVDFLNSFLQIFPYNIRQKLSFATYTPDATRYSSFKIKGVSENCGEIPQAKGITFHFGSNICLGLMDNVVREEGLLVDFFYELIQKDVLRREFLRYMANAVEKKPELQTLNMKTLNELVVIFCACSSMFDVNKVLPNDNSLTDFVTAYEKHRFAVWDEYRADAFVCLKRFPAEHRAFPAKIFTKLNKMYKDEVPASKHTLMLIILDLIHTDAMRNKLFNFIKSNYENEDEHTKALIIGNLARVYYGGFLREQILEFFTSEYEACSDEERNVILEKLFLTLRTKGLSEKLCGFFSRYYPLFTKEQKKHFYTCCLEVLCDCNAISLDFINTVDALMGDESAENKEQYLTELFKIIEKEQRRGEHPILRFIADSELGFTKEALADKIFGEWSGRNIFGEYISLIASMNIEDALSLIKRIVDRNGGLGESADTVCENFSVCLSKCDIPTLLCAKEKALEALGKGRTAELISKNCIEKVICASIPKILAESDGVEMLNGFSENNEFIKECEGYGAVKVFADCLSALREEKYSEFFGLANAFEDNKLMRNILTSLDKNAEGILQKIAIKIERAICSQKAPDYVNLYGKLCEKEGFEADCEALEHLISLVECAIGSDNLPEENELLDSSIKQLANSLVTRYGKQAQKWLSSFTRDKVKDKALRELLTPSAAGNGSFFSRLFKKK